jgi:hypothetical protein
MKKLQIIMQHRPCMMYWNFWKGTVREEHRLRIFENKIMKRIFGSKAEEVTGRLEEIT